MNKTIVVTDLTRFSDERVCLAGIDTENMKLIRPMPYLTQTDCQHHYILPGTKIAADFSPASNIKAPHTEDHLWQNWRIIGKAASDEFHKLLQATLSPSISQGFGMDINGKVIPEEYAPSNSIITIKAAIRLQPGYQGDLQKIRASITDSDELTLSFLSITDLGFYRFAQKLQSRHELNRLEEFIRDQSEIFLRLGLSRLWESEDGRKGFWLQINGIYTFPEFSEEIRSYE